MDAKRSLRAAMLANRAAMTTEQLTAAASALQTHIQDFLRGYRVTTLAAYIPFGSEPGGEELPDLLASLVPRVIIPVLLPDRDLDWAQLHRPGSLGVAAITEAELVFVPAVAVDVHGYRLGRGGGSYDRALARAGATALLVALLHEGEILADVPHEPHDQKVHLALTPTGVTKLDR